MYLSVLRTEQKRLFLKLAYILSSVDGKYSDVEKKMMSEYCTEMKIEFNETFLADDLNFVIEDLKEKCDEKERKIIVFELIGLAMVDNCYHDTEKQMIKKLREVFNLEEEFCGICEDKIYKYMQLQDEIDKLIL